MKLEPGQVAVVTGGASGLGLGLARRLAQRGLHLVIGDIEESPLKEAVSAFEADGVQVLGVTTDVIDPDEVDGLAAATLDRFGRIDVVCNNAGVSTISGPTWELPRQDWNWVMSVNLDGVLNGIRSFVPHLVAQNSGQVVNTASMAGISAGPGMTPYLVSKHAVVALSEGLRHELAEAAPGVGVTIVCPGTMATNIATTERNRQATFRRDETPDDGVLTDGILAWLMRISGEDVMAPDDAAEIVVAAVEAGRDFAFPSGQPGGARVWLDTVSNALPAE